MIIIRSKKHFSFISEIKEIWQYRELLYFFTWRNLKIKYKQTAIGIMWAIFQPLIAMVVFTIFFGNLAKMPSEGIPYPIFVYAGLLFWQFFSTSLAAASESMITNRNIITKIYFPRLILPISAIATKLVDFLVAAIILVGLMFYYQYAPNMIGLLIIPLLLIITFLAALGLGSFLAALNVRYRDVRYVLPFFIQMLLFVTPVIYPASIAGKYSRLLALNPMTGVIKGIRAALFNNAPINWLLIGISAFACMLLVVVGIYYFKKVEKHFADIV